MRYVNLKIDRDELVTINTGLMMYSNDIREDIENYDERVKYRKKIGKVGEKVSKAFEKFDKYEKELKN